MDLLEEQEVLEDENETEVWDAYQLPDIVLSYPNLKHPGDVCEAASMAHTSLPKCIYPIMDSLGKLITTNKLSSLQLEGIVYASQSHLRFLPDGSRGAFYISDSAGKREPSSSKNQHVLGVGKGRQISGILMDNFARGRMKHCWFSVSSDLRLDAE